MKKFRKLLSSMFMFATLGVFLCTNNTFGKFVYTANGLAWQSYFTAFEQVDEIFVVTPNEGEVSDKLYGPEETKQISETVEKKKNVFGTYFVPSEDRENTFDEIASSGEYKLDSIQNLEFNIQNQSDVDMFVVFNVHYYARKAEDGDACLQFALYNTIYGKINNPFSDTTGRVRKGEFLQIGDGNIATTEQLNSIDNNDPFNYFNTLSFNGGTILACQSTNDTSLDNYLAIRYGGEDNIDYDGNEYCPHNAFINQYIYGAVSDDEKCFDGPKINTGFLACAFSSKNKHHYLSSRRVVEQSEVQDFIVKSKGSAGFNINVVQGEGATQDDNCFIAGITLTAIPCTNVWPNYQQL